MSQDLSLKETQKEWHGSLRSYLIGFLLSLFLTGSSFLLVLSQALSQQFLLYALGALAFVQAICQLIFFLHLGQEAKPQWETLIFYFMVLVLLIIVLGSLWIMHDLHMRTMP